MTDSHKGNYCFECDANGDAFKYINNTNQLRDSVIGYGKEKSFDFCFHSYV